MLLPDGMRRSFRATATSCGDRRGCGRRNRYRARTRDLQERRGLSGCVGTSLEPARQDVARATSRLRVGSRLVLFAFVRDELVEINLVLRVLPTLDFEETLVHPTTPSNCSRGF